MVEGVSRFVTAQDGLRLHVREFAAGTTSLPVVCLPGLARTAADFDWLATALSSGEHRPARRVVALDYRGRGLSDWDPNPRNYDFPIESADIATVLTAVEIGRAIFVGTSRGGLHTMLLSALRPALLAGAVINDIGPVIAVEGLRRIQGYVGKLPQPTDWAGAVEVIKQLGSTQFTAVTDDDWLRYAQLTFKEENGRFVARYDPGLMHNLQRLDLAALPELWPQFDGLQHVPVLVIRGGNSDLLTADTAAAMVERHPDAALFTVPGQGHAPLLMDDLTIDRITVFATHCDEVAAATRA